MSKLTPQEPAIGIYAYPQFSKKDDMKMYTVPCTCMNEDDSITFTVEVDEYSITVSTYTTQKTDWWSDPFKRNDAINLDRPSWFVSIDYTIRSMLNSLWHRISVTRDVWIHGYVSYQASTLMSAQQAINYANALTTAVEHYEEMKIEATNGDGC
jgi:hypothetical protein